MYAIGRISKTASVCDDNDHSLVVGSVSITSSFQTPEIPFHNQCFFGSIPRPLTYKIFIPHLLNSWPFSSRRSSFFQSKHRTAVKTFWRRWRPRANGSLHNSFIHKLTSSLPLRSHLSPGKLNDRNALQLTEVK